MQGAAVNKLPGNVISTASNDRFPALVGVDAIEQFSVAEKSKARRRHLVLMMAFFLMVPTPVCLAGWYLWVRAVDQFASSFGFVVHSEGDSVQPGLLASLPAIGSFAGSSSTDSDVLARYLLSPGLITELDASFDLRGMWSEPFGNDPLYAFAPTGTIEDLVSYWRRMIDVDYDYSAGLIDVEVRSFSPDSAVAIAKAVEKAASHLINRLNGIARADRMAHTARELAIAQDRLADARQALMEFRAAHRMIDPLSDLRGELAVLNELQRDLANERIAMATLRRTLLQTRPGIAASELQDTRLEQGDTTIAVLRDQITAERAKVGGLSGDRDYPRLMGEFERLSVAVEVTQQAHVAAVAAQDAARAEADRQSRYLATYSGVTMPERATYPRRVETLALVAGSALLGWSILMLVYYGLRDRAR